MNCSQFEDILADFAENALSNKVRAFAEQHLRRCECCRSLADIALGKIDLLSRDSGLDLTHSILSGTSGPVCPRAHSLLWDFTSGDLDRDESKLISLHLEHCLDCRAVADSMIMTHQELSSMAEVNPGSFFTKNVLRMTSGLREVQPDFRSQLRAWWHRTVQRPLFSFEAAYLSTLLFFLLFSPVLPFRDMAYRKIPAVWQHAKEPASMKMQNLASSLSWKNLGFSRSLGGMLDQAEQGVNSILDRSCQAVAGWKKEGKADLQDFWQRSQHFMRRE